MGSLESSTLKTLQIKSAKSKEIERSDKMRDRERVMEREGKRERERGWEPMSS